MHPSNQHVAINLAWSLPWILFGLDVALNKLNMNYDFNVYVFFMVIILGALNIIGFFIAIFLAVKSRNKSYVLFAASALLGTLPALIIIQGLQNLNFN